MWLQLLLLLLLTCLPHRREGTMRSAPLEDKLLAAPFPMEPSVFKPGSFESAAQRRGLLRARPILSSWPAMSPARVARARAAAPLTVLLSLQQIEPPAKVQLFLLCSRIDLAFYWPCVSLRFPTASRPRLALLLCNWSLAGICAGSALQPPHPQSWRPWVSQLY